MTKVASAIFFWGSMLWVAGVYGLAAYGALAQKGAGFACRGLPMIGLFMAPGLALFLVATVIQPNRRQTIAFGLLWAVYFIPGVPCWVGG